MIEVGQVRRFKASKVNHPDDWDEKIIVKAINYEPDHTHGTYDMLVDYVDSAGYSDWMELSEFEACTEEV